MQFQTTNGISLLICGIWAILTKPPESVYNTPTFNSLLLAKKKYYLLVGIANTGKPVPQNGQIDFSITASSVSDQALIHTSKDSGFLTTQFSNQQFGVVRAKSITTIRVDQNVTAQINVTGWSVPGAVYVLDYGFEEFFIKMLLAIPLSLFLWFLCYLWARKPWRSAARSVSPP